ncbi:hypothetical protein FA13DRAFT_1793739 [Coprinellus micaceus]|uniref:Uncharacterized protein n=1 Tax=Coprinellus micaceus TaxID=71717 RepID=A0A4Y7T4F4_COPMI|nr:hypothetical protein FA13DRAFT_1793739 [Coprinellus micaceus]
MPKDAPATPSRRAAGAPSRPPRKLPRKSPQKNKEADSVDESQWRPTSISAGATINRTNALQVYRLKKDHLDGLSYRMEEKEIMIPGGLKKVQTFIYSERTIELQAWRLHGGPEGFEAYLQKLRTAHKLRSPEKKFKCPAAYDSFQPPNAATSASTSTTERSNAAATASPSTSPT